MEPTLAELQARWLGVLYAAPPDTQLNGHAVGQFGWKGLTVNKHNKDSDKELLRAKQGNKFLGSRKRPAPGSDEEQGVVRELALKIIAAHEEAAAAVAGVTGVATTGGAKQKKAKQGGRGADGGGGGGGVAVSGGGGGLARAKSRAKLSHPATAACATAVGATAGGTEPTGDATMMQAAAKAALQAERPPSADAADEQLQGPQAAATAATAVGATAARATTVGATAGGTEPTSASSPAGVTHALTIRGAQLTHAILVGPKRIENRHFRLQPGWYALHTGARTTSHESQHALLASLQGIPPEGELPHSAIVGAIRISHHLTLQQCTGDPWAFGPVCNVINAVCRMERPVPHKGRLSVWVIAPESIREVRDQLAGAQVVELDVAHLPSKEMSPATAACATAAHATATAATAVGATAEGATAARATAAELEAKWRGVLYGGTRGVVARGVVRWHEGWSGGTRGGPVARGVVWWHEGWSGGTRGTGGMRGMVA